MSRYPSDEELYRFIEELEKEELYAPRHLKEEILLKVNEEEKAEKSKNRKGQPTPFPVYTFKMAAGIAAAIFLIFMVPVQDGRNVSRAGFLEKWEQEKDEEEISLSERINDRFDRERRQLGEAVNRIFGGFGNFFDKNVLGGDHYEN
ncbi:MAG: hypothetical protein K2P13_02320 [Lachnospiraceae bacterium]|jgi:hypothetical protein|nr:hypothetical protein [Lachnospiraceae bacterium]MDE6975824.1 hypothetical protein [Lachnospiraceae bacterium]